MVVKLAIMDALRSIFAYPKRWILRNKCIAGGASKNAICLRNFQYYI